MGFRFFKQRFFRKALLGTASVEEGDEEAPVHGISARHLSGVAEETFVTWAACRATGLDDEEFFFGFVNLGCFFCGFSDFLLFLRVLCFFWGVVFGTFYIFWIFLVFFFN